MTDTEAPKAANAAASEHDQFSFYKGATDVLAPKEGADFNWHEAAGTVRESLTDAMSARHVAFLLGSGCSSFQKDGNQLGIPTMAPLARHFVDTVGEGDDPHYATAAERSTLNDVLGLDITAEEYATNLERLMEVLYSFRFALHQSAKTELTAAKETVDSVISKVARYVLRACTKGPFADGDETVLSLYQAFYRKLVYRDRSLPRPWVFSTNYDLFNETAMDRLGVPYGNGFSGTVERRFNPATFRYSLAEQLDISSRKWAAVDNFVYLCKLHGSVSWVEEATGLFPIREMQQPSEDMAGRVMIYPTPAKQNASFASPYSDLFREFQSRVVRDQSVLFTVGYGFGDEHINNIIFQALTVPGFRLIAFLPPSAPGVAQTLRELDDPRIWIIGGAGPAPASRAHYFDTFISEFMPEPPGNKVDAAVEKVLQRLVSKSDDKPDGDEV
ncbi:SIR2 family protein [Amorphus sp. 3PC139-8]|uniref:SIR2 family protein n=1 Tax=Amorphus sp. 3PC139-8 TaxID=2735676 RepID=UPI00345D41F7